MNKITFVASTSGRIDKVLVAYFATTATIFSRTKIQELITQNQVQVNDQFVHQNYLVQVNDTITVTLPSPSTTNLTPMAMPLTVLYEDDVLLVIDKPNNLVVHPALGHLNDTLVNALIARSEDWSTVSGELRPGIVHRIDRQTTGTLIIAKNDFIHHQLQEQIQTKQLQRRYLALVHGNIVETQAKIDAPIGRDPQDRKKMVVTAKNSKKAVTNILVIERFNDYTYIECELETGRTHQIRAHLKYINHPVVGDPLYGTVADKKESFGQYLHAYQLTFMHPITNLPITVSAALPLEFENKLAALRTKG
ncbi:MAG: RluA family pseudouridine synthase [Spiroplasma poulsonii]|uniref:Pseudouridine synthase n=1 Tax=Spiroplasma poulsonii TaxID=2138 RepID=A0A2P6FCF3_9MOLU|nr:RluA family pseudouridine synthase [Spiroplasma poulsonii]KAF0851522.1 Ribosomal large subunit pseudouridine synthase D [Spiroplasma poulsonii]MBW1241585.1 RluA family pseudouridine synthase [Spiroplasma poulsonii]PQM31116.1 Ribosomal large subunit pseudouridine synthase D [Spiroplasma poulsonii]PWF96115.1 Ribosomal large subunit pseudouridine synthase D [Spiroplasma poulsonii]PWF98889.1 Ribosomal large subunit pseudouridine synthase D [Spiroplasma poulsonii]